MDTIVKILERELDNTNLVYIYKEPDGRWYAYEQSAFFLHQMLGGGMAMERFIMEGTIWLARAEVPVSFLPAEYVVSCTEDECVLHYVPETSFQEWLSDMEHRGNYHAIVK